MTASLPLFEASLRKLRWGRHRISEFAWHMREYEQSQPVKQRQTATEIIIEREKSPPDELPLVLGDAIHNLRTTLDLLAADLVRRNQASVKGVYFPFAPNAEELEKEIRRKKFDRAGKAVVAHLRTIAPYSGGNAALRGLHDLDIMDKHQLIIPALQAFRMKNFRLKGPSGELVADIEGPGDGISVSASSGDVATWDDLAYTVVFGEGVPPVFLGRPIVQTLEDLAQLVDGIITSFRSLPIDRE